MNVFSNQSPSASGAPGTGALLQPHGVDTHAHIFKAGLPLDSNPRYIPDYDRLIEDYLHYLDQLGLGYGVLVQPSFLGTDNRFLLEGIHSCPKRLKGVAVINPDTITAQELDTLAQGGIVGIRLNLIGLPLPDFSQASWQQLLPKLRQRGWHVEIHRHAHDLPTLLPPLLDAGVNIVLDHFALPNATDITNDTGFDYLLTTASQHPVWVKLSAPYRLAPDHLCTNAAMQATELLLTHLGPDKLMWGSDWPHTRFESQANGQQDLVQRLAQLEQLQAPVTTVLSHTPGKLFGFDFA